MPRFGESDDQGEEDVRSFKEASPDAEREEKAKHLDEEESHDDANSSGFPLKESEMYIPGGLLMTGSNLHEGMDGSLMGDPFDSHQANGMTLSHRLFQKLRESHIQNIDRQSMVNQINLGLAQNDQPSDQSFRGLLPTVSSSSNHPAYHLPQGGSS